MRDGEKRDRTLKERRNGREDRMREAGKETCETVQNETMHETRKKRKRKTEVKRNK